MLCRTFLLRKNICLYELSSKSNNHLKHFKCFLFLSKVLEFHEKKPQNIILSVTVYYLLYLLQVLSLNPEYILRNPYIFGAYERVQFQSTPKQGCTYFVLQLLCDTNLHSLLKVSKFQNQIFLFSFEPKTERNYFFIPALRT